jgi:hypothetical protein
MLSNAVLGHYRAERDGQFLNVPRLRASASCRMACISASLSVMASDETDPKPTIQSLKNELERLKNAQDNAMALAIYVGMNKAELKECDERRKRIYELYEAIIALQGRATRS